MRTLLGPATSRDHARSDQHQYTMSLHCKESESTAKASEPSSRNICTMLQKLSDDNRRKKFDIAYFVANHRLAFNKYTTIYNLESRHGVNIGTSYVHM